MYLLEFPVNFAHFNWPMWSETVAAYRIKRKSQLSLTSNISWCGRQPKIVKRASLLQALHNPLLGLI